MIAHIGALPVEEMLPVLAGAGSGLLALRAWVMHLDRRDVTLVCVSRAPLYGDGPGGGHG